MGGLPRRLPGLGDGARWGEVYHAGVQREQRQRDARELAQVADGEVAVVVLKPAVAKEPAG